MCNNVDHHRTISTVNSKVLRMHARQTKTKLVKDNLSNLKAVQCSAAGQVKNWFNRTYQLKTLVFVLLT